MYLAFDDWEAIKLLLAFIPLTSVTFWLIKHYFPDLPHSHTSDLATRKLKWL